MRYLVCALALSFGMAYAELPPNMINQTIDGGTIHAGTYFGTTTFTNSAGGGITLPKGENIHGLLNTSSTSDGGNIYIKAPDQVVNLNGNIDVRGIGALSNGGNVKIDAAYLFQNGNIYATGFKGGTVTINVGGMTMGTGSLIDAHSTSVGAQQPGGVVTINSTGQVDIQSGTKVDVSGSPDALVNGILQQGFNNIEITGPVVNMDGVLQANSTVLNHTLGNAYGEIGGGISLVANNGDVTIGKDGILQAESLNGFGNSRTITLTGHHDINQNGLILASGSRGTVNRVVTQDGQNSVVTVPFYGGEGGVVNLSAGHDIKQSGRIVADGGDGGTGYAGANAGTITFKAGDAIINNGVIRAMGGNTDSTVGSASPIPNKGGNGGSITFVGANPSGIGTVATLGGIGNGNGALGTITAPDPVHSTNILLGVWKKLP